MQDQLKSRLIEAITTLAEVSPVSQNTPLNEAFLSKTTGYVGHGVQDFYATPNRLCSRLLNENLHHTLSDITSFIQVGFGIELGMAKSHLFVVLSKSTEGRMHKNFCSIGVDSTSDSPTIADYVDYVVDSYDSLLTTYIFNNLP